ncbi:MAG: excisionase family DNA-binding protein [Actinomycetota bacterium]|nr:excisionase family DNA-binding protein [Actinomycetota bacterium]
MNLKQAARHLGVHYQTAYKLVRSGRLAAVRVGGGYEISDAAIARYLAERDAIRRVPEEPVARGTARTLDDMIRDIRIALDTPGAGAEPVLEMVADALAEHLGDVVMVRPLSRDGCHFVGGPVRHVDPRRRAIAAAAAARHTLPLNRQPAGLAVASGDIVVMAHVPQDGVRAKIPPEMLQHLDGGGVHSLVVAPAISSGVARAVVSVTRDAPGRPYTDDDVGLVRRLTQMVGTALDRAHLVQEAHERRQAVMERVAGGDPLDRALDEDCMAEVLCDAAARVVAVNEACLSLSSIPRSEIIGRELPTLAIPDEQDAQAHVVKRLLVGELPYIDVHRTLVRDGEAVAIAAHHGVVRDPRSEPQALVVVGYELP